MSHRHGAETSIPNPDVHAGEVALAGIDVVLVSGALPDRYDPLEEPLAELKRLVEVLDAKPVAEIVQHLPMPQSTFFIGKGKVDEVKDALAATNAKAVIFDDELSPGQQRNLEKELDVRVVDRTELILEIFALRARTNEAKMQVDLARNEYMLPRLRRRWSHLERQTGGAHQRGGAGEKQIETDRRKIQRRIRDLKRELEKVGDRRKREVFSRGEFYTVSIVGYTNAGKSTLTNALTGSDLFAEDRLFATLDTRTRLCKLGGGLEVLLSDTVGFIKRVPPSIINSFLATLEEARSADLLLHVVDAAEATFQQQMEVVEQVLEDIGAEDIPALIVFNKMDAVKEGIMVRNFLWRRSDAVPISAVTGEGLDKLKDAIRNEIVRTAVEYHVDVPPAEGKALHFLLTRGVVTANKIDENTGVSSVSVKMPQHIVEHFHRRFPHIRPRE